MLPLKPVPRQLLPSNHRLLDGAPIGPSLEEQMHMVWHEAVRKDCNVGTLGGAEKMRSDRTNDFAGHEVVPSQIRANRPEKPLPADVGDVGMPWRVSTRHGNGKSRSRAIAAWAQRAEEVGGLQVAEVRQTGARRRLCSAG
jgi:hypothetical protein